MSYRDTRISMNEAAHNIAAAQQAIGRQLVGPTAEIAQALKDFIAECEEHGWPDLRPWYVRPCGVATHAASPSTSRSSARRCSIRRSYGSRYGCSTRPSTPCWSTTMNALDAKRCWSDMDCNRFWSVREEVTAQCDAVVAWNEAWTPTGDDQTVAWTETHVYAVAHDDIGYMLVKARRAPDG